MCLVLVQLWEAILSSFSTLVFLSGSSTESESESESDSESKNDDGRKREKDR